MTIYKYKLDQCESGVQMYILMPKGAEILTVALQNEEPVIWAKVNTNEYSTRRILVPYYTGQEFWHSGSKYIGTWELNGLVWHLFDAGEEL